MTWTNLKLIVVEGNLGKTASNTTKGLGKTVSFLDRIFCCQSANLVQVGDTTGAIGKGDIGGTLSGATGGVCGSCKLVTGVG